jgi:hypothetical protein
MGKIFDFDIDRAMQEHNLRHFVETGTGTGDSLEFICRFPFHTIWSCEIESAVAQHAMNRLVDDRITLFLGPSTAMLENLWRIPQGERILFWLDAHFPGADYGLHNYYDEQNESIRLPLKNELALIKQHRPLAQDVIVIDDARIWLDDVFESGAIPVHLLACRPAELGIDFIHEMFRDTHRIDVLHNQEGFIVLSPSDVMAVEIKHAD